LEFKEGVILVKVVSTDEKFTVYDLLKRKNPFCWHCSQHLQRPIFSSSTTPHQEDATCVAFNKAFSEKKDINSVHTMKGMFPSATRLGMLGPPVTSNSKVPAKRKPGVVANSKVPAKRKPSVALKSKEPPSRFGCQNRKCGKSYVQPKTANKHMMTCTPWDGPDATPYPVLTSRGRSQKRQKKCSAAILAAKLGVRMMYAIRMMKTPARSQI
jgi:hypothetical protein